MAQASQANRALCKGATAPRISAVSILHGMDEQRTAHSTGPSVVISKVSDCER